MAMTHFFYGAHLRIINELRGTKKVKIDNWLAAQRKNQTIYLKEQDVHKALDKMEAWTFKRNQQYKDD
jgi:hypothetical protein